MAENAIEWISGNGMATVTFSQIKHKNKLMKLKEKHPDEVEIIAGPENNEGYVYAHIPASWIRIVPPHKSMRVWTEEEKQALRDRLKLMREKRKENLQKGIATEQEQEVIEELEETLGLSEMGDET